MLYLICVYISLVAYKVYSQLKKVCYTHGQTCEWDSKGFLGSYMLFPLTLKCL